MAAAIEPIVEALRQSPVVLWEGRSPRDVDVDTGGRIRTLQEILRHTLRERLGMVLLTYSRATGLVWDTPDLQEHGIRRAVRDALGAYRVLDPVGEAFVADDPDRLLRAFYGLLRTPPGAQWPDGRDLRFCLLVEFAEHLLPSDPSSAGEEEMKAVEWVVLLGSSLAMRLHGHGLVLYTSDAGRVDARVRAAVPVVRIPQPDAEAKRGFLAAAGGCFPRARLDDGMDPDQVARLSANTPNLSLVDHLRRSHTLGEPVRRDVLVGRRVRDVASISEGLLTPMEEGFEELYGRCILHVRRLLERIAEGLRRGDPRTPHNVLLAGPPGSGKTALVLWLARLAGVPAYRIHSPKHSLVGETERRSRLLFELLNEWAPSVGFIDEVTEAFPTERPEMDLDAGASRAVMAAMLAYLGDERRRGRTVLMAATNCPWRMGAALRSRFVTIPVLMPPPDDYPAIVAGLVRRHLGLEVAVDADEVREAARIFYAKAASPRHIIKALANIRLVADEVGPATVLRAAQSFCGDTNPEAVALADLWAVKLTDCAEFFPWSGDPSYPLAPHLEGVVQADGTIDRHELECRIAALSGRVSM